MDDKEIIERARFIDAAKSYLGTPYHHRAFLKGVGVDCATLLICAGADAGLIEPFEPPLYAQQFNLHHSDEVYLDIVTKICHEVQEPALPGDIALWRFGRCFSHAAIVIAWPTVLHAVARTSVRTDDALRAQWLRYIGEEAGNHIRPMRLFSFWKR
jgi:cell wall-associated NlpC family hydrolase